MRMQGQSLIMFFTIRLHRIDFFLLSAFALEHKTCVATHRAPHQPARYTRPLSTCSGLPCLSTKRARDETNLHPLNPPLSLEIIKEKNLHDSL